jgi:hypothetical protein
LQTTASNPKPTSVIIGSCGVLLLPMENAKFKKESKQA